MTDATLSSHAAQFAEIVRHFIHLRARLKAAPAHVESEGHGMARLMQAHAQGVERNPADFGLLFNVCVVCSRQQEPVTMGELRQALDVPLSTATRIVDVLVRQGFVERYADANDRRVVRVALTETGQDMHQAGSALIQRRAESLLRRFTVEERENLLILLDKLAQALEEEY